MPPEEEPIDPMPEIMAMLDQMKAALPLQAQAMWSVYQSYLDAGFDEGQSMLIVIEHLRSMNGG